MKKNIIIAAFVIVIIIAAFLFFQKTSNNTITENVTNLVSKTGGGGAKTEIVHFQPALPSEEKAGDCWGSSLAALGRNDAYRCNIEEQEYTYDPCFVYPGQDTVICNADPLGGVGGFKVLLKKPLPGHVTFNSIPAAWAWLLQLSDGTVCAPSTGSRAKVDGKTITYGCKGVDNNDNLVIAGELDGQKPLWKATLIKIKIEGGKVVAEKTQNLDIVKAWQ
jgi:hypothetical protein